MLYAAKLLLRFINQGDIMDKKIRLTKCMGVTFSNDDGTKRQDLLASLNAGDELKLVREKDNPFDNSAIAIFTKDDQQLGYLKKDLARDLAPNMDKGVKIKILVMDVTGGSDSAPTRGLNIQLEAEQ